MSCPQKLAAPSPHPSAAELLAECAALPRRQRVEFAAKWGQLDRRPDRDCLSPADRAGAEVLALSCVAWLILREVRAGLARKGEKGARVPFAFYVTAVSKAKAAAASAGLALPAGWFSLNADLLRALTPAPPRVRGHDFEKMQKQPPSPPGG